MYTVLHNPSENRFEVKVDNHVAYVDYTIDDTYIDITHTKVPKEIGGRGIASLLVAAAYEYGKSLHLKPKATCT